MDRDTEATYPLPDFIAKLRRLADSLEAGKPFRIQIEGERVTVPENAVATIEHEREEGEHEIEFQLKWQTGEVEEGEDEIDDDQEIESE